MGETGDASGGDRRSAFRTWLPALALLLASTVAVGWLELRPRDDRFVAAVFPPWWGGARSIAAVAEADGAVMGQGGLGSIVLTRSDREGFAERLHRTGAWLLLEPSALIGCGARE